MVLNLVLGNEKIRLILNHGPQNLHLEPKMHNALLKCHSQLILVPKTIEEDLIETIL
jgi:hypothetical protein